MRVQIGSVVFFIFFVFGVAAGYNVIRDGSRTLYQFYYQPENLGFGCICSHAGQNIWTGSGSDGCGGGDSDRAINLNDDIFYISEKKDNRMPDVTIPPGACCKPQPKISLGPITGFRGDGCPS
jgi:hypothetical protein